MSTFVHQELRCHACGESFEVPLLKGMHITRIPEVRKSIMDGSFQVFDCPHCAERVHVERTSIYTDFQAGHYVAIEPTGHPDPSQAVAFHRGVFDRCFMMAPPVAQELSRRMAPRVVFGLTALREKLLCWDNSLDDRVLEVLKVDLMKERGWSAEDTVLRLIGLLGPGHMMIARYPRFRRPRKAGHQVVQLPAPVEHITLLSEVYDRRLSDPARARGDAPWVYEDWLVDASLGRPAA